MTGRAMLMLPPGTIAEDELTDQEKQMMAQNQQKQQLQEQLAMAQAKAEISDKEAQANLRTAQSNLALAQAYKAQSDAQSRAADVASKNQDREVGHIQKTLDQHNDVVEGDQKFALALADQQHGHAVKKTELEMAADQQIHDQQIARANQRFQDEQATNGEQS